METENEFRDAYKLFASVVGIDPKDYCVFAVSNNGDVITITPGRPSLRNVMKSFVKKCIEEDREEHRA